MNPTERIDHFKAWLGESGLKFTRQRQAIAEVFFGSAAHLSLVDLLELSRVRCPSVGYATVYRTMKILADSGLATEHKFAEGQVRYEASVEGEHHDHLICLDCGRIVEYEDERIEALQVELARRHGFQVAAHKHEIYGNCITVDCPERSRPQETNASSLRLPGVQVQMPPVLGPTES